MDDIALGRFRKILEEMVAELSASLDAKSAATATVELDGSIGRVSRIDARQSQQIAIERLEIQPEAVLCVDCAAGARRGTR